MRLALLAALLLAPAAGAVSALEETPRLGATEARLVLRAEGELTVRADAPLLAAAVPPGGEARALVPLPATIAPATGPWHGLEGLSELVLVRERADVAAEVEVLDATGAGLVLEWPADSRRVPAAGALALVALALAARNR